MAENTILNYPLKPHKFFSQNIKKLIVCPYIAEMQLLFSFTYTWVCRERFLPFKMKLDQNAQKSPLQVYEFWMSGQLPKTINLYDQCLYGNLLYRIRHSFFDRRYSLAEVKDGGKTDKNRTY